MWNRTLLLTALLVPLALQSARDRSAAPPKTVYNPAHLSDTTRFGYSQAAASSPDARLVFVAGQIADLDDPRGPGDFRTQVDSAFDNLIAALEAAGAGVEDVIKITLLVKDHDDTRLRYLVEKRRAVFGTDPPASTLIPVPVLALDSLEFEIDAVAAVAP